MLELVLIHPQVQVRDPLDLLLQQKARLLVLGLILQRRCLPRLRKRQQLKKEPKRQLRRPRKSQKRSTEVEEQPLLQNLMLPHWIFEWEKLSKFGSMIRPISFGARRLI